MALSGSFTFEQILEHETETETTYLYYPLDLPEGHPEYALRGTTGSVEVPLTYTSSIVYPSAYINVANVSSYSDYYIKGDNTLGKNSTIETSLKVWESYDEYLAKSSSILDGSTLTYTLPYDFSINSGSLHEYVYNFLKTNYTEFSEQSDV